MKVSFRPQCKNRTVESRFRLQQGFAEGIDTSFLVMAVPRLWRHLGVCGVTAMTGSGISIDILLWYHKINFRVGGDVEPSARNCPTAVQVSRTGSMQTLGSMTWLFCNTWQPSACYSRSFVTKLYGFTSKEMSQNIQWYEGTIRHLQYNVNIYFKDTHILTLDRSAVIYNLLLLLINWKHPWFALRMFSCSTITIFSRVISLVLGKSCDCLLQVNKPRGIYNSLHECLTLKVRGPSYLGLTWSISWLLLPWLLTSLGHQQPWYWLYRICRSFSYLRKDFRYLCHIKWHRM